MGQIISEWQWIMVVNVTVCYIDCTSLFFCSIRHFFLQHDRIVVQQFATIRNKKWYLHHNTGATMLQRRFHHQWYIIPQPRDCFGCMQTNHIVFFIFQTNHIKVLSIQWNQIEGIQSHFIKMSQNKVISNIQTYIIVDVGYYFLHVTSSCLLLLLLPLQLQLPNIVY